MKKNIIVKGNIGTGKTRKVIFPQVMEAINNRESLVTYSTTEEYLSEFQDMVREDYNVITINFNDLKKSMGWNPLSYSYQLFKNKQEDEAIFHLEILYHRLFGEDKNNSMDDFWINSAETLSLAATLALFKMGEEEKINIEGVFEYISNENIKENLKNIDDKNIEVYAKSFIASPMETTGGIISVCLQNLGRYASRENLRSILSNTTYNYEDIVNKPTAVFIISDEDNRIFVPLIISLIRELSMLAKKSKNEFKFILDDFEVLMPSLDDDFNYLVRGANKNGITFILGIHDEDMLISKFGNYILTLTETINSEDIKG